MALSKEQYDDLARSLTESAHALHEAAAEIRRLRAENKWLKRELLIAQARYPLLRAAYEKETKQ